MQEICLNLSEIFPALMKEYRTADDLVSVFRQTKGIRQISRMYIGSSFCGTYFLSTVKETVDLLYPWCEENGISLSLNIPVFHQDQLLPGKRCIEEVHNRIDEFVVNDYGMLLHLLRFSDWHLRLGRLMFKKTRDPRYRTYTEQTTLIEIPDELRQYPQICGFDIDSIANSLRISEPVEADTVGVYIGLTYMTTGNICTYKSMTAHPFQKFHCSQSCCQLQCNDLYLRYTSEQELSFYRIGKTMFYKNDTAADISFPCRLIYSPFELWECKHEYISSSQ